MHYKILYIILKILHPCSKILCKQDELFYKDLYYSNCYTIYYHKNGNVYKVVYTN